MKELGGRFRERNARDSYNISAIFGSHVVGKEIDNTRSRLTGGALNSFVWPQATIDAVRRVGPKLITVDSLSSYLRADDATKLPPQDDLFQFKLGTGDTQYVPAYDTWMRLPGDPTKLNPSGNAWVVLADSLVYRTYFPEDTDLDINTNSKIARDDKSLAAALNQRLEEGTEHKIGPGLTSLRQNTELLMVSYLLCYACSLDAYNNRLSRRKFLGYAAASALAIGAATLRGTVLHDKNLPAIDVLSSITDTDLHKIPGADWIDARNALYVLKTKDAIDTLIDTDNMSPEDQSTIVAGGAHAVGMNRLMESDTLCEEVIRRYVGQLNVVIDQYTQTAGLDFNADVARQLLKKEIASMDIIEFGDEKVKQGLDDSNDVLSEIKRRTHSYSTFSSQRVLEAIHGI